MFLFSKMSRPDMGPAKLPVQWVLRALYPRAKRPKSDVNHLPLSSVEFKNAWS
jgi:hypothetical protein